jgi:DNA (cytosine-5)-methyltransferase 1
MNSSISTPYTRVVRREDKNGVIHPSQPGLFDNIPRNFSVVSLFSGAGGLDLGFRGGFTALRRYYAPNPFDIIWANDLNPAACRTYRRNVHDGIREGDVWEHLETLPNRADVVIGGFPCQDISVNGKGAGISGAKSRLYRAMVKAVEILNPRVFVVENVKALNNKNHQNAFRTITSEFEAHGYEVTHHLYNAANYGVPQTRERMFIVGRRPEVAEFVHPAPTLHRHEWVTAQQAIGDLENRERDEAFSHTWSLAAVSGEQGDRHLIADRPGYTVRAEAHGNTHWHYSLPRRMTNREAARIQSFPDDFIFDAMLRETERMIGNAVPPVLAWHISRAVAESLRGQPILRGHSHQGLPTPHQ